MKAHRRPLRRPSPSLLACALASCMLVSTPQIALAQTANASLRGQVIGVQAGQEVTATNVATGAVRRTRTSADGRYTLAGLPPGTYRIEAGPGLAQTVTLSVASSATLDLRPATGVAETPAEGPVTDIDAVLVTAPLLKDVRTSEVGNTVSLRQIQQLPQASRNFLEFADTVPGMAFETDAQGFTSLRSGAQSNNANNLYIDGIGQKSYVEAGGIAGQNLTRGNPFPQLAIGEYKVITSNYKAEYGQVSGAAITAATRSGTNEFEGEVYYRYTDQDFREKRPDEKAPGRDKVESKTKEYGAAFGGPIIRDRLHFFLVYEYKDFITARSVVPNPDASEFTQFLPPDVQALYGPASVPFEEDLYFGKLSWNATDNDLVEFSAQYRDEVQVDSVGGQRAAEHGRDVINKDKRTTLRWQHSAERWLNELVFTTEDTENNPFPRAIGNGIIYAFLDRDSTGRSLNERTLIETGPSSGFDAAQRQQDGWSVANNLTFTDLQWHGDHTVKMGVSYKDITLVSQDAGDINPQFRFEVDASGVDSQPYRVDFLAPFNVPGQRARVETEAEQYGFFIQDDWAVNDHLILNLGVRWDYEKNPAYTNFVTPQSFVDAIFGDDPDNPGQPWANRLRPSGLNAADYISTGNNREDFKDAWAPRFGFSYDIGADERHVIKGGAGRSYDRNLFRLLSLEVSKAALSPVAVYFQDPATGQCYRDDGRACVPWNPSYLQDLSPLANPTGSVELFLLNNELKTPYSDQFSLGMSNQIGDWLTDVTVQRILSYDGFIFTLINRYPDGSFFQNGSQPWGEPVPGFANTIIGNNGIESQNTQILLSADKPYTKESGWGLSLAYTRADAKHNRQKDDNFAFDKATIDDYPFITVNGVPKHRFVAAGSIDGPWGITFGAKIVLETPRPFNTIRDYGNRPPDGSFSQPIAYTPPGTGSFLIGGDIWGYRTVDLQATKEFSLGDYAKLTARVNVLNVFDFENFASFDLISPGANGRLDPQVRVNEFGDSFYVPRTISFEVGLKF